MRLQFNRAVHVGGRDFARGVHEVPEAILSDKVFLGWVEKGFIVEAKPEVAPPDPQVGGKALLEKLTKVMPGVAKDLTSVSVPVDDVPAPEEEKKKSKKSKS
jgi:hypothetical protein